MTEVLDTIRRARESGDFSELLEHIPYAGFLGFSVDTSGGELIGKMNASEHLIGNPMLPALHGGTLGALLESTAMFKVLWESDTVRIPKIINITVEYLRSGKPVDTYAQGEFSRQGRRVANVRVHAWQQDRHKPVAAANAHFLLVPPEDAEPRERG